MLLALCAIKKQNTYYVFILLCVLAFSVFCATRLANLKFNYDFEAFFPNEDDELEHYNAYRKTFEYDNEFVLIALENKSGIFRKAFLLRVDSLTKEIASIQYVKHINSPTNLKSLALGGFVPIQTQLLHFEDESAYAKDSALIYNSPFLVGSYFPENAQSLSLFIKTDDILKKKQCDELAKNLESSIQKYKFDEVHMVGRIFAQNVYLVNLQKEFSVFLLISFFVVLVFLWFSFKSVYGIVVPVSIVMIAILWTLGIMDLMGKPIDLMSAMLPTMIFVAGMSDVVHFFSKYFEEISKGTEPQKVYKLIVKEVGFPTFLTLVTTVVGFLSLLFSSIKPIREFGIYTSVGVTMAFILTYTLLPALLHLFKPKKLITVHTQNNGGYNLLQKGLFLIFRNQKTILLVTALIVVASVIGITKIKVNNILLEDLSDKVKLKQDFNFFDKNYSGVRPFELSVTLTNKNKSVWDYEVITELNKLDEFIKKEYNAGFILSPAALVKNIYVSSVNNAGDGFPDKEDYESIAKYFKKNKKNKEIKRLVSEDGKSTRISGKIADLGSIKINEHDKNLLAYIEKNVNKDLFHFEITGAAHLIDRNNEYMVTNMTQGFVFSIIVIGLLTFFLHRSWRMVVVFIIPNIIPLIVIGGIMGYAGIELKAATSLVFSIAFGIATDDTIHFISRLKIELAYGKSLLYAFKRTYFETGKPIALTTFILMGGFMSLMISNFESTFYFGFLICITVVVALIADLFLLPVLLLAIYRSKDKK